jgi:hypothetical protein
MAQYCHGLDKREFDTFLEIWHVDAVWEMGDLGVFAGKEAIGTVILHQGPDLATVGLIAPDSPG